MSALPFILPSIQSQIRKKLQPLIKFLYVEHFLRPHSGANELTVHLRQEPVVPGLDKAVEAAVNKHLVTALMKLLHEIHHDLRTSPADTA